MYNFIIEKLRSDGDDFEAFNGAIAVISDLHNFDKSLNELLMVIMHASPQSGNFDNPSLDSIKPE